jgi:hypothetical protein
VTNALAKIHIHHIKVGVIEDHSGIHYGTSIQSNWKKKSRSSEGFGTIEGDSNALTRNHSIAHTADTERGGQ